jgi:ribose transport system substrate-binding protein
MKNGQWAVLTVMVMLLFVLFACREKKPDPAEGGLPKIYGVYASLAQDYYHMMEYGAYCAGADLGADVYINGPAVEGDVTTMLSMIEDAITAKADAIIITPWDTELMTQSAKYCYDNNIPFVVLDTDLSGEGRRYRSVAAGVASQYAAAEVVGDYILKNYPDGGSIAIIRGNMGQESHNLRVRGVADKLEASGKWKVLGVQPADSDRSKGTNVAENFMEAFDDITIFYATNDEMALGAYAAVENSGRKIDCIGFDATTDALKSILDGKLKASLAQKPLMLGYMGIEFALKLLNGEKIEGVDADGYYAYTPDMKDSSNAKEYLDSLQADWDRGMALKRAK